MEGLSFSEEKGEEWMGSGEGKKLGERFGRRRGREEEMRLDWENN